MYAFFFDPQPGATLILKGPASVPVHGEMLETHEPVIIAAIEGGFSFTLPENLSDTEITVIAFE